MNLDKIEEVNVTDRHSITTLWRKIQMGETGFSWDCGDYILHEFEDVFALYNHIDWEVGEQIEAFETYPKNEDFLSILQKSGERAEKERCIRAEKDLKKSANNEAVTLEAIVAKVLADKIDPAKWVIDYDIHRNGKFFMMISPGEDCLELRVVNINGTEEFFITYIFGENAIDQATNFLRNKPIGYWISIFE